MHYQHHHRCIAPSSSVHSMQCINTSNAICMPLFDPSLHEVRKDGRYVSSPFVAVPVRLSLVVAVLLLLTIHIRGRARSQSYVYELNEG